MESTTDQIVEFETALDAFLASIREEAPSSQQWPRASARRRANSLRAAIEVGNELKPARGSTQHS